MRFCMWRVTMRHLKSVCCVIAANWQYVYDNLLSNIAGILIMDT